MDCYKYTKTSISSSRPRHKIMPPLGCLLIFVVSTILVQSFSNANLITPVEVEGHKFPPMLKLQKESDKIFFLGGAGVRGLVINTGLFVKFTSIAVYMENTAIKLLAPKWKGKSGEELNKTEEFFRDIITGPYEKFTQVRMIEPLEGKEYSRKVAENCIHAWKALKIDTIDETHAIQAFLQIFQNENFPSGSSIYFTQKPSGSLKIGFSHGDGKVKTSVINNKKLSEAILMSIIGQDGVSPAARQSLADRLSELLKKQA